MGNATNTQGRPLTTSTGRSRGGAPLALNQLPADDLQPWFTWLAVTDAELPVGQEISCGMLTDHDTIRVIFGGSWYAETVDGPREFHPGAEGISLYFGPQSRIMRLRVDGSFKVATLHLGAGASTVLGAPSPTDMLDRIADFDGLVGQGRLGSHFDPAEPPDTWLETFERELRKFIAEKNVAEPDPITLAFERAMMADSNLAVSRFAEAHGVSVRTLERIVKRDYGMTPKQALRRARALDLAATLIGVAREDEDAELRLRYFDQSHQIREIRHFFDMTPGQLRNGKHPLLTLNLEIRQSRRVDMLSRLAPGQIQPWRDPEAEPARAGLGAAGLS